MHLNHTVLHGDAKGFSLNNVKYRDVNRGESNKDTPMPGYIVEYPLSDVIKNELMDGRQKGVGLLVGRNMDRGDAKNLPTDQLDICEVEPLRQEEVNSNR